MTKDHLIAALIGAALALLFAHVIEDIRVWRIRRKYRKPLPPQS